MNKNIPTITGIIIVVVAAISVIGLLAWQEGWIGQLVVTPTPTPTTTPMRQRPMKLANWKTYRNEKYGFLLRYPDGTRVRTEEDNFMTIRTVRFDLPFDYRQEFIMINSRLSPAEKKLISSVGKSIEVYPEGIDSFDLDSGIYSCPSGVSVPINGINFTQNDVSGSYVGTQSRALATQYCVMKNGKAFTLISKLDWVNTDMGGMPIENFSFETPPPEFNQEKELEILNQMLSTFRFVE